MNILILGATGYLGWVTLLHFTAQGHNVLGVDSKLKQIMMVKEGVTALEIEQDPFDKIQAVNRFYGSDVKLIENDICTQGILKEIVTDFKPDTIIDFAEQPSAPLSMKNEHNAIGTIANNLVGTLRLIYAVKEINPDIHIIKLGTMGEYGTPNIDIEEGWLDVKHNGRTDRMLFPKSPHSIYHLSKVNDSDALAFACRVWGLKVTDLNQGFVYGMCTPETEATNLYPRFCYDSVFGTVLNRFLVQAELYYPLTIYGTGGQKRPMININDVVKCIQISCENPASAGEFKVFNQFTEVKSISDIANLIERVTSCPIENIVNPRIESEIHHYNPSNKSLLDLGLEPTILSENEIQKMTEWVSVRSSFIDKNIIKPQITWE